MSIESFASRFGSPSAQAAGQTTSKKDLPKAQIWMNIGFMTTFHNPETQQDEQRFISLPQGIPVDTMEKKEERGSSDLFRAMMSAQNNLLEQIKAKGDSLQPGEEVIIAEGANGLCIQLRRVKAEQAAIDPATNPLIKQLVL